jgi:hypothetical protein
MSTSVPVQLQYKLSLLLLLQQPLLQDATCQMEDYRFRRVEAKKLYHIALTRPLINPYSVTVLVFKFAVYLIK